MKNSRKHGMSLAGKLLLLTWLGIAYIGLSAAVYLFKHPKMTETEMLANLNNIVTWNMERVN